MRWLKTLLYVVYVVLCSCLIYKFLGFIPFILYIGFYTYIVMRGLDSYHLISLFTHKKEDEESGV